MRSNEVLSDSALLQKALDKMIELNPDDVEEYALSFRRDRHVMPGEHYEYEDEWTVELMSFVGYGQWELEEGGFSFSDASVKEALARLLWKITETVEACEVERAKRTPEDVISLWQRSGKNPKELIKRLEDAGFLKSRKGWR